MDTNEYDEAESYFYQALNSNPNASPTEPMTVDDLESRMSSVLNGQAVAEAEAELTAQLETLKKKIQSKKRATKTMKRRMIHLPGPSRTEMSKRIKETKKEIKVLTEELRMLIPSKSTKV